MSEDPSGFQPGEPQSGAVGGGRRWGPVRCGIRFGMVGTDSERSWAAPPPPKKARFPRTYGSFPADPRPSSSRTIAAGSASREAWPKRDLFGPGPPGWGLARNPRGSCATTFVGRNPSSFFVDPAAVRSTSGTFTTSRRFVPIRESEPTSWFGPGGVCWPVVRDWRCPTAPPPQPPPPTRLGRCRHGATLERGQAGEGRGLPFWSEGPTFADDPGDEIPVAPSFQPQGDAITALTSVFPGAEGATPETASGADAGFRGRPRGPSRWARPAFAGSAGPDSSPHGFATLFYRDPFRRS